MADGTQTELPKGLPSGMCGKFRHTIDGKGRMFVPARLRKILGESFYVTIGFNGNLLLYTESSWHKVEERYVALSMTEQDALGWLFAYASQCEPDKQGRFLIPQDLREYAKLGQEAYFIGQVDHAEIWNIDAFDKREAEKIKPENLKRTLEELGF